MVDGICRVENIPEFSDVTMCLKILENLGANIRSINRHTVEIDCTHIHSIRTNYDLCSKIRASYYLIGSLLGVASLVLFFQMDMVASLSGLILAFCTLKGYEMLGKKLGNIGIIICILIMLAAPILAYIIDGAIYFTKEWDMGFMDSFKFCIELIKSGAVTVSDIFERVGMVYLFAALGGVGTIVTAFKANKK